MSAFSFVARVYRSEPSPVLFGELVACYGIETSAASLWEAEDQARETLRDAIEAEFSAANLPTYRMTLVQR
jgi:hypothetical protein